MLGVSILWEVLLNSICRFLEETWVTFQIFRICKAYFSLKSTSMICDKLRGLIFVGFHIDSWCCSYCRPGGVLVKGKLQNTWEGVLISFAVHGRGRSRWCCYYSTYQSQVWSFLCLQVLCLRDTYSAKVLAPLQGLTLDAIDIINQFMTTELFIGWDDLFVPCKISGLAVWSCRMFGKSIDLDYFFLLIFFLFCCIWYVKSILQKYPSKFLGMCLADPTEGGGGVKELERLVEEVFHLQLTQSYRYMVRGVKSILVFL